MTDTKALPDEIYAHENGLWYMEGSVPKKAGTYSKFVRADLVPGVPMGDAGTDFEFELMAWVGDEEIVPESTYEVTLTGKTILAVQTALHPTPPAEIVQAMAAALERYVKFPEGAPCAALEKQGTEALAAFRKWEKRE